MTATDGAGAYALTGLDRASEYRITPLKPGATFEPPSRDVAFTPNSFPGVLASFTRTTNLVVTGQVLTTGGAGLVGAVITFTRTVGTGAVPLPVTTTSNGEYHAAGLDAGTTYLVSVTRDQFSSAPTTLRAAAPGTTTLNLTAFPAYEVSGRVLDLELADADLQSLADLPGIPGAIVSFHPRDATGSAPPTVVTDSRRQLPPTRVRSRRHVRRPGLRRRLRGLAAQQHLRQHRRGDRRGLRRTADLRLTHRRTFPRQRSATTTKPRSRTSSSTFSGSPDSPSPGPADQLPSSDQLSRPLLHRLRHSVQCRGHHPLPSASRLGRRSAHKHREIDCPPSRRFWTLWRRV